MPVIHIEPPTKEEIEAYKKAKNKDFLKSFSDEEKMKRMKPKAVVAMKGRKIWTLPKMRTLLN